MVGMGALVCVLFALISCSPASRVEFDAPPDVPYNALCGNGVIDEPKDAQEETIREWCDDGPLNGTVNSLCSKQCKSGVATLRPMMQMDVGVSARTVVNVRFAGEPSWGLAFTSYDDTGIPLPRGTYSQYFSGMMPPIVSMKVAAAPVALGQVHVRDWAQSPVAPIWIERAGTAFRMFVANVDSNGQADIAELPYPFADGTSPRFAMGVRGYPVVVLLDRSSVTNELLIALIQVRSPTDVETRTLRVPSPGQLLGLTVPESYVDAVEGVDKIRVVQFFEDTRTFVAIEINGPTPAQNNWSLDSYGITESARGAWPYRVVAGLGPWIETCYGPLNNRLERTHPAPIVTLDDNGDVIIWPFSRGLASEEFVEPFGHVEAGSLAIGGGIESVAPYGLMVLAPSGDYVALVDGDCDDPSSTALKPQTFSGPGPWSSVAQVQGEGGYGALYMSMQLDTRFLTASGL